MCKQILLENGANEDAVDLIGRTASSIAQRLIGQERPDPHGKVGKEDGLIDLGNAHQRQEIGIGPQGKVIGIFPGLQSSSKQQKVKGFPIVEDLIAVHNGHAIGPVDPPSKIQGSYIGPKV